MSIHRVAAALLLSASLVGCAFEGRVAESVEEARTGPRAKPTKNITNFSDGLRCMDRLMVEYGIRDVGVLMEDLTDRTGQIKAGTRDMLIAAVSEMTKRSHGVRINAFGNDSGNLVSYIAVAGRQSIYAEMPPYDIRGSISQLDKGIVRQQQDAGLGIPEFGGGVSESSEASVLGLDLSVISTDDLSVIPGVSSRNSIVLLSGGKAVDADASISKAGINFSMSLTRADGKAQALRNLIELATIELFGRLFKLPYWTCLEIPVDHPEIQEEIADWYYSMETQGRLLTYLQEQLLHRGYYDGPADGADGPGFRRAVGSYRSQIGLDQDDSIDLTLLRAVLTPDGKRVAAAGAGATRQALAPTGPYVEEESRVETGPEGALPDPGSFEVGEDGGGESADELGAGTQEAALAPDVAEQAGAAPRVSSASVEIRANATQFGRGESLRLRIQAGDSGYLTCYYTDENRSVMRIFPNRYHPDGFVTSDSVVRIPGSMPFEITASSRGVTERVNCFLTSSDVLMDLPDAIGGADFEDLGAVPIYQIRDGIRRVAGGEIGEGELDILVR